MMKVIDVINRIDDIYKCAHLLSDLKNRRLMDQNQINALVDDVAEHLDCYIELLQNKQVKWND